MSDIEKEKMDTRKALLTSVDAELLLGGQKVTTASVHSKKTSRRLSLVLGTAMVAFAALLLVIFIPTAVNVYAETTKSPVEYYQSVEKSNLDKQIDAFSKGYGNYLDNYKTSAKGVGTEVSLKATLDPSIATLMDLKGLKSMKASILSMQTDQKSKSTISLFTNDKEFTTLDLLTDTEKELAYILIPELNKAYLKMTTNPNYGELSGTTAPFTTKELTSLLNDNPLTEILLNELLKKYAAIMVAEIDNVTIAYGDKVTVGDITAGYTKITAKLDEKTVLSIAEKMLVAAKEDEELLNLCVNFKLCTKPEYNINIKKALDDIANEKMNLSTKEEVAIMTVLVDDKGNIAGRDISYESDSETISFGYKTAKEDTDLGFEAWVTTDKSETLKVVGKVGIMSKGVSGDVTITYNDLSIDSSEVFNIKLDDLKYTRTDSSGYINGKFTITGESLLGMSILVKCTGDVEQQTMKMDFDQGENNLVSVLVESKLKDYKDFKLPSESVKIYDAETQMDDYMSSADIKNYLKGINEKIDVKGINTLIDQFIKTYSEN